MRFGLMAGALACLGALPVASTAVTLTDIDGSLSADLLTTPSSGETLDGFTVRFNSQVTSIDLGLAPSFTSRIIEENFGVGEDVSVEIDVQVRAGYGAFVTYGVESAGQSLVDFVAADYDPVAVSLTMDVTRNGAGLGASVQALPCSAVTPQGGLFDLITSIEAGCAVFTGGWWMHDTDLNRFVELTAAADLTVEVRLAAVPLPATGAMLLTALGAGIALRRQR